MKRILSLLLFGIFSSLLVYSANIGGRTIYFNPGEWNVEGEEERYAAFLQNGNSPDKWYDLTDADADGIYSFVIDQDADQTTVIFCKMNVEKSENVWENRLLQAYGLVFGDEDLATIGYVSGTNSFARWSFFQPRGIFVVIRSLTPFYYGDTVLMEVIENNGPYTWYYSSDNVNWTEIYGASDSYEYVVSEDRYFKVVDKDGKTDVLLITASKKVENLKTFYTYDFGDFTEIDGRSALEAYPMLTNFNGITEKCSAIKNSGSYAVLANASNAGCYDMEEWDVDCNCTSAGSRRWYRDIVDHTEGDTYGGMLLLNCGEGSDELFNIQLDGIPTNTDVEFSFYLAAANVGNEYDMPVNLDIALRSGEESSYGEEIGRISMNHMLLDDGWRKITAIFNTGNVERASLVVYNTSEDTDKNDILVDDVSVRVNEQKLQLNIEGENQVLRGETIKLNAKLEGENTDGFYYLWQKSVDNVNWVRINNYLLEDTNHEAVVDVLGSVYYRVVASKIEATLNCLAWSEDKTDCNLDYITSNTIEVVSSDLELSYYIPENTCVRSQGPTQLDIIVKNPLNTDVENVKIKIPKDSWDTYKFHLIDSFNDFDEKECVWNVGSLASNETKTLSLDIETSSNYLYIQVYVSEVNDLKWYTYYTSNSYIELNHEFQYNSDAWNLSDIEYCGTRESNLVEFASCYGLESSNIRFYEDIERQNEVTHFDTSIPVNNKLYYAVFVNDLGCESEIIDVKLTVKEPPLLVKLEPQENVICTVDGGLMPKIAVDYKVEGGKSPYYLYYKEDPNSDWERSVKVLAPEGSFELYPTESRTYKFTRVQSEDGCDAEQDISEFKVFVPSRKDLSLYHSFMRGFAGQDYTLNFDDSYNEFDTYQWQASYDGGKTYVDLKDTENPNEGDNNIIVGAETPELKIINPNNENETIWYRMKLSNSEAACIYYYTDECVVRMDNNDVLSMNISTNFVGESVCENEFTSLFCIVSNDGEEIKVKENIKIKLEISDILENLSISPSVGTYDPSTKIWSIDRLDWDSYGRVTVSFTPKEDETIKFSLISIDDIGYDNVETSIAIKVIKAPTISELNVPDAVCSGTQLSLESPIVESDAYITNVSWSLDGTWFDPSYSVDYSQNGAMLEYEVSNRCGTTKSNGVTITVKGIAEMEMLSPIDDPICEGQPLNIAPPYINTNGDVITSARWLVDGEPYVDGEPVPSNGKGMVELLYEIESECAGVQRSSWGPSLIVNQAIVMTELRTPAPICENGYLNIEAPSIGLMGFEYIEERWVLDGEILDVGMPITSDKNGAKLHYEVVQMCAGVESIVKSNEVEISVVAPVKLSNITESYSFCEEAVLPLDAPDVEYSVEPNDRVKYTASWRTLDEYDNVVIEDYRGQKIDANDNSKKLQYVVTTRVYNGPNSYDECETATSNSANITFRKKPSISWMNCNEAYVPSCSRELTCKLYSEDTDEFGGTYRNYYINWNNNEDEMRVIKTYLAGEEVSEDYVVKYPEDNGKQYYYVVENECGTVVSDIQSLSLIEAPEFYDYEFAPICVGEPLVMPDKTELVSSNTDFDYVFYWRINDSDFTKEDLAKYSYPVGQAYNGEGLDESYHNKTIYYYTSSECGNVYMSSPTKIKIKSITLAPEVEDRVVCPSEQVFDLTELVLSDKTELKFYESEDADTPISETKVSLENASEEPLVYTYWVTNTMLGECESPRSMVSLTVEFTPISNAGEDKLQCDNEEFFMSALPKLSGAGSQNIRGEWTIISTIPVGAEVEIEEPEMYNSKVIVPAGVQATLRWTVQNRDCAPIYDEVVLQNIARPVLSAMFVNTVGEVLPADDLKLTCETNQITVTLSGADYYVWADGDKVNERIINAKGTYTVVGHSDLFECSSRPMEIIIGEADVYGVTATPEVVNYDECSVKETKKLSSLVVSPYNNLKFYSQAEGGEVIDDSFDASKSGATVSYWVTNTDDGLCESERAEIQVHVEGDVKFNLDFPSVELPMSEEVELGVTETSDAHASSYVWYINDEKVKVTYSAEETIKDKLYIKTKYSVEAIGRCNSDMKEVWIDAIWPTAITPYNANGKNDVFAEGMHIAVFNRYYQMIFEGYDGWDGSINVGIGNYVKTATPDVYFYCVYLSNGEKKVGSIEIVRM